MALMQQYEEKKYHGKISLHEIISMYKHSQKERSDSPLGKFDNNPSIKKVVSMRPDNL